MNAANVKRTFEIYLNGSKVGTCTTAGTLDSRFGIWFDARTEVEATFAYRHSCVISDYLYLA